MRYVYSKYKNQTSSNIKIIQFKNLAVRERLFELLSRFTNND